MTNVFKPQNANRLLRFSDKPASMIALFLVLSISFYGLSSCANHGDPNKEADRNKKPLQTSFGKISRITEGSYSVADLIRIDAQDDTPIIVDPSGAGIRKVFIIDIVAQHIRTTPGRFLYNISQLAMGQGVCCIEKKNDGSYVLHGPEPR